MKRVKLFLTLAVVPAVLIACSAPLDVTVFNNTGDAIEVITDHSNGKIEPDKFDDFQFPSDGGVSVASHRR